MELVLGILLGIALSVSIFVTSAFKLVVGSFRAIFGLLSACVCKLFGFSNKAQQCISHCKEGFMDVLKSLKNILFCPIVLLASPILMSMKEENRDYVIKFIREKIPFAMFSQKEAYAQPNPAPHININNNKLEIELNNIGDIGAINIDSNAKYTRDMETTFIKSRLDGAKDSKKDIETTILSNKKPNKADSKLDKEENAGEGKYAKIIYIGRC
jgi:hypothetical protein